MKATIRLPISVLNLYSLCSKDPYRENLACVQLKYQEDKITAIATDGHILGRVTFRDPVHIHTSTIYLRADSLKETKAVPKKVRLLGALFEYDTDDRGISDGTLRFENGVTLPVKYGTDVSFPDTDQVIPPLTQRPVEESIGVDFELFGRVTKWAKDSAIKPWFTVAMGGPLDPIRIDGMGKDVEALFVVMPMRKEAKKGHKK